MVAVATEVRAQLYRQQFAFVGDRSRYVAFVGGRGSGKTFAGVRKSLEWMSHGGLGVIAGPSFPAVKVGPKRAMLAALDEAGITYRENKNDATMYVPRFNAEVQFAGLENDTYLRGPNFSWGWIDELDYVADASMWRALKGSVREGSGYQLFVTSTPKGRFLLWQEWVRDADDFHALYRASSLDNVFIDAPSYVAGLGYSGRFYEQEIEAAFVTFEGLVYSVFERERHVMTMDTEGWAAVLGVDAGVRNPSAILTIRHAGERRHIQAEVYRRGMGQTDLRLAVEAEADRVNAEAIEVDPSAAGLIVDLLGDGYPAVKANNAVQDGIRTVSGLFADDLLTVDPSCVNTIAELESYAYPENARTETDNPIKQFDHCLDAARYGLLGLSEPVLHVGLR